MGRVDLLDGHLFRVYHEPMNDYEIKGRDGFYVKRQIVANALQLVVGRDIHPGGYWIEWVTDGESKRNVKNQARRMIRAARSGLIELPPIFA